MRFQVTVRHGRRYRYHTYTVEADDARSALLGAADDMPEEVAAEADLVEVRPAPEADEREYVGEGGDG